MTTQSIPAQSELHKTTLLNIDFTHRLSTSLSSPQYELNARTLSDSVDCMAHRAMGVLNAIQSQFTDENESLMCYEDLYWSLDSVTQELRDIQQICRVFYKRDGIDSLAKQNLGA